MLDDPDQLEALGRELLARADRLRAAPAEVDLEPLAADGWLSEAEAAELVGITASGMAKHRHRQTGPVSRTVRGRPMYRRSVILVWIAARKRQGIVRTAGLYDLGDAEDEA